MEIMKNRSTKICFLVFSIIFDIAVILAITLTENREVLIFIMFIAIQVIIWILLPEREDLKKKRGNELG